MSVFDLEIAEHRRADERLRSERIAWLTTVAADGTPQSSPIWFTWDGETVLARSEPGTWKLRNIAANPSVSLHLEADGRGGSVVTVEGVAHVSLGVPAERIAAYDEKYEDGYRSLGMDAESFAAAYSVRIVVTPTRARAWGHGL